MCAKKKQAHARLAFFLSTSCRSANLVDDVAERTKNEQIVNVLPTKEGVRVTKVEVELEASAHARSLAICTVVVSHVDWVLG